MRAETFMVWMFVGFWLLMLGTLLSMLTVTEELAKFLAMAGLVYPSASGSHWPLCMIGIWPSARERGESQNESFAFIPHRP